jgi:hypothetical protein
LAGTLVMSTFEAVYRCCSRFSMLIGIAAVEDQVRRFDAASDASALLKRPGAAEGNSLHRRDACERRVGPS